MSSVSVVKSRVRLSDRNTSSPAHSLEALLEGRRALGGGQKGSMHAGGRCDSQGARHSTTSAALPPVTPPPAPELPCERFAVAAVQQHLPRGQVQHESASSRGEGRQQPSEIKTETSGWVALKALQGVCTCGRPGSAAATFDIAVDACHSQRVDLAALGVHPIRRQALIWADHQRRHVKVGASRCSAAEAKALLRESGVEGCPHTTSCQ